MKCAADFISLPLQMELFVLMGENVNFVAHMLRYDGGDITYLRWLILPEKLIWIDLDDLIMGKPVVGIE